MSVSGIGSSTITGFSQEMLKKLQGAKDSPDEFASSFVNDKDKDGDGLLTLQEAGIEKDKFTTADTDGDGFLTPEEITADLEQRNQQMGLMGQLSVKMQGSPQDLINSLINQNDKDEDGALDLEESGLTSELFGALDADNDGSISASELDEALKPPVMGTANETTVAASSGATERPAASSAQGTQSTSDSEDEYDEYDLNKDGVVSMDELMQAYLNGNEGLSSIVGGASESKEQSTLMRIAMRAYQTQETMAYSGLQNAVV